MRQLISFFLLLFFAVFTISACCDHVARFDQQRAPTSGWDAWLQEHVKHCQTCDKAFNHLDEAETGMCPEAFDRFKEALRQEKAAK